MTSVIGLIWSVRTLRVMTWCCVVALAVLSLLPGDEIVRTGLPRRLEHVVAYVGSAAIAMLGYGRSFVAVRMIGCFWFYAAALEYLQNFSPGRDAEIADFLASALGVVLGALGVLLLRTHLLRLLPR